ncbi:TetR family transcriptional regulator, partial [Xanthomonas oryzae pv. oryzae]
MNCVGQPQSQMEPESKLRQRTEGRLDRSRDPAILDAALAALAEHGY